MKNPRFYTCTQCIVLWSLLTLSFLTTSCGETKTTSGLTAKPKKQTERSIDKYVVGMQPDDKITVKWLTIDRQLSNVEDSIYYIVVRLKHGQRHQLKGYFSSWTDIYTSDNKVVKEDGLHNVIKESFTISGAEIAEIVEREKVDIPADGLAIEVNLYRDAYILHDDPFSGLFEVSLNGLPEKTPADEIQDDYFDVSLGKVLLKGLEQSGLATFEITYEKASTNKKK